MGTIAEGVEGSGSDAHSSVKETSLTTRRKAFKDQLNRGDIADTSSLVSAYNTEANDQKKELLRDWLTDFVDWFVSQADVSLNEGKVLEYAELSKIKIQSSKDENILDRFFFSVQSRVHFGENARHLCVKALVYIMLAMDKSIHQKCPFRLVGLADCLLRYISQFPEKCSSDDMTRLIIALAALYQTLIILGEVSPEDLNIADEFGVFIAFKIQLHQIEHTVELTDRHRLQIQAFKYGAERFEQTTQPCIDADQCRYRLPMFFLADSAYLVNAVPDDLAIHQECQRSLEEVKKNGFEALSRDEINEALTAASLLRMKMQPKSLLFDYWNCVVFEIQECFGVSSCHAFMAHVIDQLALQVNAAKTSDLSHMALIKLEKAMRGIMLCKKQKDATLLSTSLLSALSTLRCQGERKFFIEFVLRHLIDSDIQLTNKASATRESLKKKTSEGKDSEMETDGKKQAPPLFALVKSNNLARMIEPVSASVVEVDESDTMAVLASEAKLPAASEAEPVLTEQTITVQTESVYPDVDFSTFLEWPIYRNKRAERERKQEYEDPPEILELKQGAVFNFSDPMDTIRLQMDWQGDDDINIVAVLVDRHFSSANIISSVKKRHTRGSRSSSTGAYQYGHSFDLYVTNPSDEASFTLFMMYAGRRTGIFGEREECEMTLSGDVDGRSHTTISSRLKMTSGVVVVLAVFRHAGEYWSVSSLGESTSATTIDEYASSFECYSLLRRQPSDPTWTQLKTVVEVLGGFDLNPKDKPPDSSSILSADPYYIVRFDEEKYISEPVSNSLDPLWPVHPFDLGLVHNEDLRELNISVFDNDVTSGNDFMGEVRIPAKDLYWLGPGDHKYVAELRPTAEYSGDDISGNVRFIIRAKKVNRAMAPPAQPKRGRLKHILRGLRA